MIGLQLLAKTLCSCNCHIRIESWGAVWWLWAARKKEGRMTIIGFVIFDWCTLSCSFSSFSQGLWTIKHDVITDRILAYQQFIYFGNHWHNVADILCNVLRSSKWTQFCFQRNLDFIYVHVGESQLQIYTESWLPLSFPFSALNWCLCFLSHFCCFTLNIVQLVFVSGKCCFHEWGCWTTHLQGLDTCKWNIQSQWMKQPSQCHF